MTRVLLREFAATQRTTGNVIVELTGDASEIWSGDEIVWLICPIYQVKAIDGGLEATSFNILTKAAAARAGLDQHAIDAFGGEAIRGDAAQDLPRKEHRKFAIIMAGDWINAGTLAHYLKTGRRQRLSLKQKRNRHRKEFPVDPIGRRGRAGKR